MNREYDMHDFERRKRTFLETIEPLIKMKVRIYNVSMPCITVYENNEVEYDYTFSEEQRRAIDGLNELIEQAKRACFGEKWCP